MSRFTWVPQWSAECSEEPRVNKVSFGDGYEQRQTNGLNADLETWSVKFKETPDTILQIKTFLQECGGVDTFSWITPEGRLGTFICRSWSKSEDDYGWRTLSTKFEEVPEKASAIKGRITVVTSNAPPARALSRSVVVGTDIYFIGGFVSSGIQHTELWKYNAVDNYWTQLPSCPSAATPNVECPALYGPSGQAVYYNGNIYVPGYHYNIYSNSWVSDDPMFGNNTLFAGKDKLIYSHTPPDGITLMGRVGSAIASAGSYLLTGIHQTGSMTREDLSTGLYTPSLLADTNGGRGASAVCRGNLHLFGGSGSGYRINSLRRYNNSTNTWTSLASSPVGRTCHALCEWGGNLYLSGGYNGSNLTDLWKYSPVSNSWIKISDSFPALNRHMMVGCAGELYVFGGTTNSDSSMPDSNLSNVLYRIS